MVHARHHLAVVRLKKLYCDYYLDEQNVPFKCRTDSDKERLTFRHWREAMIKRDIFLKILFVTFEKLAFLITWSIEISNETFALSGAHSLQFRSYHKVSFCRMCFMKCYRKCISFFSFLSTAWFLVSGKKYMFDFCSVISFATSVYSTPPHSGHC